MERPMNSSHGNPVRLGVVALGRAGWNIHVKQIEPRHDARVVAVADPLAARREEAAQRLGCRTYAGLTELLRDGEVEVVVVATPSHCHGADTLTAIKAGKHVIVEKPMAANLAEADAMIAAAERHGRRLFVHHNLRFERIFTHLQEVARSGILGQLYHVRHYVSLYFRRNDWQTLARYGGGVLNNMCSHNIDRILQLLDAPAEVVHADLRRIASGGDAEDHVKACFRAANGRTADMEISTAQNVAFKMPLWILCGTDGTLSCDGEQSVIRWLDPGSLPPLKVDDAPPVQRDYSFQQEKLPWGEKIVPAVGPDIGGFYDNVTAVLRQNAPMIVTPPQARDVVRVTDQIRRLAVMDEEAGVSAVGSGNRDQLIGDSRCKS